MDIIDNLSIADGFGGATPGYAATPTTTDTGQKMSTLIHKKLGRGEFFAATKLLADIPTPSSGEELADLYKSVFLMGALDQLLIDEAFNYGMPFSFKFEQSGATVQNIFPIKAHANSQISSSSATRLQMHTETAFHPKRPDFVMLYCLRSDASAGTTLAHIADILKHLSKADIKCLQQPLFSIVPDMSFVSSGADPAPRLVSVFNQSCTDIVYDEETMTPTTGDAEVAFARLQQAIQISMRTITLEQSEILVIPNRHYIHGRLPFTARYDGSDRWLKRIMLRSFDSARQCNDGMTPIE